MGRCLLFHPRFFGVFIVMEIFKEFCDKLHTKLVTLVTFFK